MRKVIFLVLFCFLFTNLHAQWSADQRLTFFPGYSYDPRAACYGDTIHLVWWESYAYQEVFYKRSTDCGLSWGDSLLLSIENDDSSVQPNVGVNGNFVHVVWKDEHAGVCYRKSTDGGNTWLQIDTLPNAGLSQPWIHADGVDLYVVAGHANGNVVFTKSTDNGDTWQTGQNVMHSCGNGRIDKMDSVLVLTHQDVPYSVEIYCLRSFDDGQTWNDVQCISEYDSISGQWPVMDIDNNGGIHIAWYDYKYSPYAWTGDIFYRTSRDSGNTWEVIDSLTVAHRAVASDILAEGSNLHLVWEDDRHDFNNNFEIYYRSSTDLGQSWGPEVRLTDTLNWSRRPSLACNGQHLHLFWFDLRDDTSNILGEIYYKRKDLVGVHEDGQLSEFSRSMLEVFPNPVHQDFNIHYTLPQHTRVNLSIYDIAGRLVNTPINSIQNPGSYQQTFNTGHLSQGVYFVRLRTSDKSIVEKVIFLK